MVPGAADGIGSSEGGVVKKGQRQIFSLQTEREDFIMVNDEYENRMYSDGAGCDLPVGLGRGERRETTAAACHDRRYAAHGGYQCPRIRQAL